jgi:GntR family transcriptional regulator, transcriptional repressor for pyruvate dehydrogenase complex
MKAFLPLTTNHDSAEVGLMKVEQIKSYSAPERVVKQFLRNLETRETQPGQKLPTQEQLAKMFGVSRSSIREAMNALSMMGYLEITRGRGSYIREELPSNTNSSSFPKDLFEHANLYHLMEIRELLECYAAEKASKMASEDKIAQLRMATEKLEESITDLRKFSSADLNFHVALAEAANLPELGDLLKGIYKIFYNKLPVVFATSKEEKVAKSIDTAKCALDYIIKGEGKQAARCMRNHLSSYNEELKDELFREVVGK